MNSGTKPGAAGPFRRAAAAAFPHTIPVLTGFLVLGMAYGVLMDAKGCGGGWAVLTSAVCFCGSMQFAAVTLFTVAFDPLQAFLLSLMVNARHVFYGLSLLEKYRGLGKVRLFLIAALCDETFSIVSSVEPPPGVDRKFFYLSVSLLDYLYWVAGTFLGTVLGGLVSFDTTGLDFVLTALFAVLFMEQLKTRENLAPGLTGLACALAGLLIFGAGNMVIPSMAILLAALLLGRGKQCA